MKLKFTKMHGAGNDFVVVDATRTPFRPAPELLARLSDRRFGVGCDQILVVEPADRIDVDFNYRIYNSDGSESGQCGNGARALARFVRENQLSAKDHIRVRTQTSVLELQHLSSGEVRVNMGAPRLEPSDIPLRAAARQLRYPLALGGHDYAYAAVSMGNPHAVFAVADVEAAPVATLGPLVQQQPQFPESVNVGFIQIQGRAQAALRVYERGAGETLACGSGACAAAVAGRLWGELDEQVTLRVRGGTLKIEWAGEGQPVYLTGPAETVFTGEITWPN